MKLTRSLLLIALPAALAAQGGAPAGPPANPIANVVKNASAGRRANIIRALDSIPADMYSFKPTEKQQTIGYIAAHVASDSYLFCNALTDTKATVGDDEQTPDSVKATWPKDKLLTRLRAADAFCTDVFNKLDDATVTSMGTVPGPNNTTRQVYRLQYAVAHATDLADHYSQLANYMRLKGLTPPTALPRPGRGGN